eukprot:m.385381 g.385381  ORF g.385381 m.385381 type:complete len:1047 (+) comp20050_c9_seq6:369-3509(+)
MSNPGAHHVAVLLDAHQSQAAKLAALRTLTTLAEADRLGMAMAGTLPVLSGVFQNSPPGSELEAACKLALNQFLTTDALTPSFVRHLVGFLSDNVSPAMEAATGALGVITQRIYHPDTDTQSCIMSCMPRIKKLLESASSRPGIVCNLCRIIGGLSEASNPDHRVALAKTGMLSILAQMYQDSEPDSDIEASSLSALNKLALYEGEVKARRHFLDEVLVCLDDKDLELRVNMLGTLTVLNSSIYGADEATYAVILKHMSSLLRCLTSGTSLERCHAAKVLEGFGDSPIPCHFAVLRSGATGCLVDVGNNQDQPASVKAACTVALARLVGELDPDRKDALFKQLYQLWLDRTDDRVLYAVSRFVYDLGTTSNAPSTFVDPILAPLIDSLLNGKTYKKRAALMMLHKLCMLDDATRQRAIHLGCIPPAVALLKDGELDDQEIASYALVTFSCGMIGAEVLAQWVSLFIERLTSRQSRKLESGMTSVLGNLATFLGQDGRQKLVQAGVVDILLPIMRSKDPSRMPIVAALAIGNLAGSGDDSLLAGDDVLIRMIVEAVSATAAGREFQRLEFQPWAPTMCLMHLSHNDANKKLIIAANGLKPLVKLVKSGDLRTQMYAARVFWNVSFTEDVEAAVPEIVQVLREVLVGATDTELRFTCEGTLFQMAQRSNSSFNLGKGQKGGGYAQLQRPKALDSDTDDLRGEADYQSLNSIRRSRGTVMLTYHWKAQPLLLWLAERLEREGFSIWIDLQQKANTIDSVAKAIERSDAVVIVASLAYRESETCRTEAEYALKNKKKLVPLISDDYRPDGWLERALRDSAAPLDFSGADRANWDKQLPALVERLAAIASTSRTMTTEFGFVRQETTDSIASATSEETLLKRAQFRAEHAERRLQSLQKRMQIRPDVVDAYDHFELPSQRRRVAPEPTYGSFLPLVYRPPAGEAPKVPDGSSRPGAIGDKVKTGQRRPSANVPKRSLANQPSSRPAAVTMSDTDSKGYARVGQAEGSVAATAGVVTSTDLAELRAAIADLNRRVAELDHKVDNQQQCCVVS